MTETKGRPTPRLGAREIAVSAVMAAATAGLTMLVQIPFPPTRGYFNLGDFTVLLSGLTFGSIIGGFAGGLGSALADILTGYGFFAPLTLFIKGAEGYMAGLIGRADKTSRMVLGATVGGLCMLLGYFSVEIVLIGFAAALFELLTINWVQVLIGAVLALPVSRAIRRVYPDIGRIRIGQESALFMRGAVGLVIVVAGLAMVILFYSLFGVRA